MAGLAICLLFYVLRTPRRSAYAALKYLKSAYSFISHSFCVFYYLCLFEARRFKSQKQQQFVCTQRPAAPPNTYFLAISYFFFRFQKEVNTADPDRVDSNSANGGA